ncbi:MAG: Hpt domain-containing protein [Sphaerochaetaceae bacterium]|nr:Hpt domain-containing protein [Sphaerochaetaceae bacterium]
MTIKEFYDAISGNYNEALGRLMKDSLIQRFVLKFANDQSFTELSSNLESGNTQEAFRAAHTLKGVCMNLAFTKLGNSASEITELLRADNLEMAKQYFPTVKEDYELVISCIAKIEA